MLRLRHPVIGVNNLGRAVAFWAGLLGHTAHPDATPRRCVLEPTGDGTPVVLMVSTATAEQYPRVHLDFAVDDRAERDATVQRVVDLGGSVVHWPHTDDASPFVVVADTEGNRFCIVEERY